MSGESKDVERAEPLFVDTSAFFAWFHPNAARHETSKETFDAIVSDKAYRPLYTSRYVLSELATLMLRKTNHEDAVRALSEVRDTSSFWVLGVDSNTFGRACGEFERYDDHEISFVDHLSGVLCEEYGIDRVFTFDSDFRTLGFAVVPEDTEET